MGKLMLEIDLKMIALCEKIDLAKLSKDLTSQENLEKELGRFVFEAMEKCPF